MLSLTRSTIVALVLAGACSFPALAATCTSGPPFFFIIPCATGTGTSGPTAVPGGTNAVTAQIQESTSTWASPTGQPGSSQPTVFRTVTCGASYTGCVESISLQSSCQSKTSTCVSTYSDGTSSSKSVTATPPGWDDPSSAGSANADPGAYPD